jgi:hypothetical protein
MKKFIAGWIVAFIGALIVASDAIIKIIGIMLIFTGGMLVGESIWK